MKVAVIGAGAAGLCSARHLIANNFECIVFEQNDEIGGTWVYTDQVGFDKYGLPVHTSMYQGLKTNLPKETMGFPDYPIPESDRSYLPQEEILKFLQDYTDHFNLRQYIKFYNHVKHLHPIANDRWELLAMDVRTKGITRYEFDAVMVCNGHYHTPNMPNVAGAEDFRGLLMHSHDYRSASQFEDMDVLIIGAGPSGVDLVLHTSEKAKRIIFSHHSKENITSMFPSNVIQKPDVKRFCEDKVIFVDGSDQHIDAVIYCTGFKYTFPFMSPDCGITVDDNYVKPLYKHLINIERPTMALVGLPFYVCAFQMFDIQVRLFLKTLTNQISLPSKEDMLKESKEQMSQRFNKGFSKHQAHMMGPEQINYYNDVTEYAKLDPVPNVMTKMHNKSSERFIKDIAHFREDVFKIIDDENFELIYK